MTSLTCIGNFATLFNIPKCVISRGLCQHYELNVSTIAGRMEQKVKKKIVAS
jgi:hypothetical protein